MGSAALEPPRHNGGSAFVLRMARSSLALFLAIASLIATLSGCGGEGADEKRERTDTGGRPGVSAPLQDQGGEGGEAGEGEDQERRDQGSQGGEGGEGGEG